MYEANQSTSEEQINRINEWMRSQQWYQDYFRQRGLNPNQVHLTEQQRHELAALAQQNGVQLGDRMKIDEAGNVNQMGGFAGMPTWGKIALAAAPAAATFGLGAMGIGPTAGMFGAGSSELAASAGAPAATEAGIFGGAGAGAAMAGGGAGAASALSRIPWGDIAKTAIPVGGALAARAMTGGGDDQNAQGNAGMPPELAELLGLQLNRIRQAQPNYELMLNMARGMAPQWAREQAPQGGGGNPPMADMIQRMAERR